MEGCVPYAHARMAGFAGVLGNQDRGLGKEADDHDHARLQVDVVFHVEYFGRQETSEHSERDGANHGQGDKEAFVKRTQQQIYQDRADKKDEYRVVRLVLFAGRTSEIEAVALGECLFSYFPNSFYDIAGTVSGRNRGVSRDAVEEVEPAQAFRPGGFLDCHELAYGSHLVPVAEVDVVERAFVQPVFGFGLDDYPVHFGKTDDVGSVNSSVIT